MTDLDYSGEDLKTTWSIVDYGRRWIRKHECDKYSFFQKLQLPWLIGIRTLREPIAIELFGSYTCCDCLEPWFHVLIENLKNPNLHLT